MRICGTGGALANTPIMQDKAYFEVRVQQTGAICCGKLGKTMFHVSYTLF